MKNVLHLIGGSFLFGLVAFIFVGGTGAYEYIGWPLTILICLVIGLFITIVTEASRKE